MPIVKEPLRGRCFFCKKYLLIKFVPPKKAYSKKNNWDFWTEKEKDKKKKICDDCLRNLFKNYKKEFRSYIANPKLRKLLGVYANNAYYKDGFNNPFKIKD